MNNTALSSLAATASSLRRRATLAALSKGALAFGLACMPACKPSDKAASGNATGTSTPEAKREEAGTKQPAPAAVVIEAKPINLRRFALPEGASVTGRTSANLTYKTKGDAKSVYEFQRKQFLALGWKELPDAQMSADTASGNFSGAGCTISATVYPFGGPGLVTVMLNDHGSVDFARLPVPAGAKTLYAGSPLTAMFVTDAPVAETIEATRKVLLSAGWEAHGGEGGSCYYKQGLNRILASIQSAPAQGGKTAISYTGELMSGDLSAPPDAQGVTYSEAHAGLTFKTKADKAALTLFYREKLAKAGWKQDEEKTFRIDDYDQMGYYSPEQGVMFLKVWAEQGGLRNAALEYISREEIADMDKASNERKEAAKAKNATGAGKPASTPIPAPEPEPAGAALPKVAVVLPADASNVEKSDQRVVFHVPKGRGQAVTEGYQKQFKDAGWKEETATFKPTNGTFACSKDGDTSKSKRVFFNYTDFGTAPAEIKISSFGARLDPSAQAR